MWRNPQLSCVSGDIYFIQPDRYAMQMKNRKMIEHYFPALSVKRTLTHLHLRLTLKGGAKSKKPYQFLGKIAKKRNLRNPKCGGTQKRKALSPSKIFSIVLLDDNCDGHKSLRNNAFQLSTENGIRKCFKTFNCFFERMRAAESHEAVQNRLLSSRYLWWNRAKQHLTE